MSAFLWASTSGGRIELSMSLEQVQSASHPGPCDMDVLALSRVPEIAKQLADIEPAVLRVELREYGAWDESQLADHRENLQRIVWLLANDIADEQAMRVQS
jgi:hypothetical protein